MLHESVRWGWWQGSLSVYPKEYVHGLVKGYYNFFIIVNITINRVCVSQTIRYGFEESKLIGL